jgi:hypothetical protein
VFRHKEIHPTGTDSISSTQKIFVDCDWEFGKSFGLWSGRQFGFCFGQFRSFEAKKIGSIGRGGFGTVEDCEFGGIE